MSHKSQSSRCPFLLCLLFSPLVMTSTLNTTGTINTAGVDAAFRPSDFHLKDVRTISLGQGNMNRPPTNTSDPPCVLGNSSISSNSSNRGNMPCLNYETLWENDTLTLTYVGIEKNQGHRHSFSFKAENWSSIVNEPEEFTRNVTSPSNSGDAAPRRFRRIVLGKDTRVQVPLSKARKLPFSAVVKLSVGCTGTLITQNHVLTSAHCVHNGTSYENIKTLRVGPLNRRGKIRWFRVEYIKVPSEWTIHRNPIFDYALLKLERIHRHHHVEVATLDFSNSLHDSPEKIKIQFISFPGDKAKNTMWYSYCSAYFIDEFILNKCDSHSGSSGSGIYFKNKEGKRFISGVFSGSAKQRYEIQNKKQRFNVATRITPLKLLQIQNWALLEV